MNELTSDHKYTAAKMVRAKNVLLYSWQMTVCGSFPGHIHVLRLNSFHILVIRYTDILLSLLYTFGSEGGDCVIMYLIWGELLQMHYLKSGLAACCALGVISGAVCKAEVRLLNTFSGCCLLGKYRFVFCEKTSTLTFVDVVFIQFEIKSCSRNGSL